MGTVPIVAGSELWHAGLPLTPQLEFMKSEKLTLCSRSLGGEHRGRARVLYCTRGGVPRAGG